MRKKKSGDNGFNVWRSYSDMMAGVLLLFVLIMCVTLFQAQKSYDESIQERDERIALQEEYTQEILAQQSALEEKEGQLQTQDEQLQSQNEQLAQQEEQLAKLAAQLEEQETTLNAQKTALDEQTALLHEQQVQIDQIIGVKADVVASLRQEFAANNVNVDIDSQTGALTLDANVMFDYDDTTLLEEGEEVLSQILPIYCQVLLGEEYRDNVAEIIIDGYTDTNGDYDYNLELSQKSFLAVAQYLLSIDEEFLDSEQIALLQEKLTVNGHSMSDPILNEDGSVNMEASRRVEVKFRLKDEEMISEMLRIVSEE